MHTLFNQLVMHFGVAPMKSFAKASSCFNNSEEMWSSLAYHFGLREGRIVAASAVSINGFHDLLTGILRGSSSFRMFRLPASSAVHSFRTIRLAGILCGSFRPVRSGLIPHAAFTSLRRLRKCIGEYT